MTAAPSVPDQPGRVRLRLPSAYANEAPRLYRTRVILQAVELSSLSSRADTAWDTSVGHICRTIASDASATCSFRDSCMVEIIVVNRLFKYDDALDARPPRTVMCSHGA